MKYVPPDFIHKAALFIKEKANPLLKHQNLRPKKLYNSYESLQFLGVDEGEKGTGLAILRVGKPRAYSLNTIGEESDDEWASKLKRYITDNKVDGLVFGNPTNPNFPNRTTSGSLRVYDRVKKLSKYGFLADILYTYHCEYKTSEAAEYQFMVMFKKSSPESKKGWVKAKYHWEIDQDTFDMKRTKFRIDLMEKWVDMRSAEIILEDFQEMNALEKRNAYQYLTKMPVWAPLPMARTWREGDWVCTNCQNHNYASRLECNRCNTKRVLVF